MEKMKALYEKVAGDSALQAKFNEIMAAAEEAGKDATEEKLAAFAKDLGYDVTIEEMQEFFKTQTKAGGELSETELDHVAGGKTGIGISLSIATLGFACAVGSAATEAIGESCKDYLNQ